MLFQGLFHSGERKSDHFHAIFLTWFKVNCPLGITYWPSANCNRETLLAGHFSMDAVGFKDRPPECDYCRKMADGEHYFSLLLHIADLDWPTTHISACICCNVCPFRKPFVLWDPTVSHFMQNSSVFPQEHLSFRVTSCLLRWAVTDFTVICCGWFSIVCCLFRKQLMVCYLCICMLTYSHTQTHTLFAEPDVESHLCSANTELNIL